jgi:hypothetical protein
MHWLFVTENDHRYTSGETLEEAYREAKRLMGRAPIAFKLMYFSHDERSGNEALSARELLLRRPRLF